MNCLYVNVKGWTELNFLRLRKQFTQQWKFTLTVIRHTTDMQNYSMENTKQT